MNEGEVRRSDGVNEGVSFCNWNQKCMSEALCSNYAACILDVDEDISSIYIHSCTHFWNIFMPSAHHSLC